MKTYSTKRLYTLAVRSLAWLPLMAMLAIVAAACGGGGGTRNSDSDTALTAAEPEIIDADTLPMLVMTKDSIGLMKIGREVSTIPLSIDGFYTDVTMERGEISDDYVFSRDGEYLFTACDFGQGKIDLFMANGSGVKVATPIGYIGIGDSFRRVLDLPSVRPEWIDSDDIGMWYWTCDGIWYAPAQQGVSAELEKKLTDPDNCPQPGDFGDDIPIGYIGTGIPF